MSTIEMKRIKVLRDAAENKRVAVRERILKALKEMEARNIDITFQSVARYAQVSKTVLYANNEISNKIKKNRDKGVIAKRMLDQQSQLRKKDEKIALLTKRVEYLNSELYRLKVQLETAYGELYKKLPVD